MDPVDFFGYKIFYDSTILGKKGAPLKFFLSKRRGGKYDKRVKLYIDGKPRNFTVSRLVAGSFKGYIEGFEVGHNDRDTLNCHGDNLNVETPSQNQRHWRNDEKEKKERR